MAAKYSTQNTPHSGGSRPYIRCVLLCLITFIVLSAGPASANPLKLKNLVLDNQAGSIMARFGIELKALNKVKEALLNGVKLKLECQASLMEHRSMWPDSEVAGKTYSNKLYFDSLSKQYVLEKPGVDKIFKNEDLGKLISAEWKAIILDLGPWSILKRGERYKLQLKVQLDQTEVPKWLKSTLFFWSWDVIPSATYKLNFTY